MARALHSRVFEMRLDTRVLAPGLLAMVVLAAIACSDPARDEAPVVGPYSDDPSGKRAPESPAESQVAPGDVAAPPAEPPSDLEIARATARDAALAPPEMDWSGGNPGKGAALYAQHCNLCHGPQGKGDGPAAAALNPKPRDFTSGVFYLDANADNETGEPIDLARVIRDGPGAFGGSELMVGFGPTLSDDDIRDLVAFVRSLAGRTGS